jgi:uncharacterized protein YfiM (DUF2279 family)
MFDTLFTPDQYLTKTTQQKIDQILANPRTLTVMRRTIGRLKGSTGGASQMQYDQCRMDSGMSYSADVLYGLNQKIIDSRKRARNMGFPHNITLSDLLELWIAQQARCAVTGVVMQFESGDSQNKNAYACSIDRIDNDPDRGYVLGNVRLLTHWANNAKSTWPDSMFEDMITEIVNNRKTNLAVV